MAAAILCALASGARAGTVMTYACDLAQEGAQMPVRFSLDHTQLAPPISRDEPPQRVVAKVDLNGRKLVAEAVALPGGWAGFHADTPPDVEILMIVDPEGSASLSFGRDMWRGTCELDQ